jgi:hypothetical protein
VKLIGGPFDGLEFEAATSPPAAWGFELNGHRYLFKAGRFEYAGHFATQAPDPAKVQAIQDRVRALTAERLKRRASAPRE